MRKLLAILLLLATPAVAQITSSDFTYEGAFKLPETTGPGGQYINGYGQRGMTYDSSGDGGSGSLWITGHDWVMEAYEVNIPTPSSPGTAYGSLTTATVLTSAFDTRGGVNACNTDSPWSSGIEIHGSYIWFGCGYRYTVSGANRTDTLWRRDASDLANPSGPYRAGPATEEFHSSRQGAYLFTIPSDWVTANLDGNKSIGTGQCRNSHGGAPGPTFIAYDPSSTSTAEVIFAYRPGTTTQCSATHVCDLWDYTPCDIWNGGTWVNVGTDDALLVSGVNCYGDVTYSGGWFCTDCHAEILLYSGADMAASLAGYIEPYEVLPYERWRPSDSFNDSEFGGMAYDSANGKLYVVEKWVISGGKAVVHVYSSGTPSGSSYVLTVTKAGDGTGTVTSSPAGISCGVDCSELYADSTAVTLTATPAGNSTFDGWSGDADCSDGSVTMSTTVNCTATFSDSSEPPPSQSGPACPGFEDPSYSQTINLTTSDDIVAAIEGAEAGTLVTLAPGTYDISGGDRINMSTANVTVKGTTGNAEDVILDASYGTDECLYITASNISLADFTIKECSEHNISLLGSGETEINNFHAYNLVVQDSSSQQMKARVSGDTGWVDDSIVECSTFLFTDTGRANVTPTCYNGAIDAHGVDDWIIRDNKFEGFWCATGLPDPAVHFWNNSRDTIVERNLFVDNARDIMFGGPAAGTTVREPVPDPYPGDTLYHYDGIIRNNMIFWNDSGLQASATSKDSGIQCENCKRPDIYNNTLVGTFAVTVSAVEVRYADSEADLINNLTTESASLDWVERNSGTFSTNTTNVNGVDEAVYFVDDATGDLHLTASATSALDAGTDGYVTDDYDSHPRANPPDVGADEYNSSASSDNTLTISKAGSGTGTVNTSGQGIDCGSDCTEDYDLNTVVILDVSPDSDSFFRYWSGDADCQDGEVTMSGNISCTANFAGKNFPGTSGAGVDVD